jgi:hypothetical protein
MKKILIVTLLSILYGTAVQANQLDILPVRSEIRLKPGETKSGVFTVRNTKNVALSVTVEKDEWFVLPGNPSLKTGTTGAWLICSPEHFKLKPEESRQVQYTVNASTEASGELAAKISFTPDSNAGETLVIMMSVSLYAILQGTEKPAAAISQCAVRRENNGYVIAVAVKNDGNVHFRPWGTCQISKKGKIIKSADIPSGYPVYPKQEHGFFARLENTDLEKGTYKAKVVLNLDFKNMLLEREIKFKVGKDASVTFVK